MTVCFKTPDSVTNTLHYLETELRAKGVDEAVIDVELKAMEQVIDLFVYNEEYIYIDFDPINKTAIVKPLNS